MSNWKISAARLTFQYIYLSWEFGSWGVYPAPAHTAFLKCWTRASRGIMPSLTIKLLKSCCEGSSSCIRRFWDLFPGSKKNCSLGLWRNKLHFVLHKLVPFLACWEGVLAQVQDVPPSALPGRVAEPREAGILLRQISRSSVCWGDRTGQGREGQASATLSCLTCLSLTLWYQPPAQPPCQAGWGQPQHQSTLAWWQLQQQSLGGPEARSDSLAPVCPSHSAPHARTDGCTKSPLFYSGWGNVVPHLANRAVTN